MVKFVAATSSKDKSSTRPQERSQEQVYRRVEFGGPRQNMMLLHQAIGNRAMGRFLQAKLRVNQPGDRYEQEADRVAEHVMRMPEPTITRQPEEEEELQRQPVDEEELQRQPYEEDELQTKMDGSGAPEVSDRVQSRIDGLRGGGQPLPESARAFFEPRFGRDFGQIRVHSDSQAVEVARAVNAKAFAIGRDVVFGAGQFSPGTTEGRRLLAHELTHVVQQNNNQPGQESFSLSKLHQATPRSTLRSIMAAPIGIMRGKAKATRKAVGWVIKVGERKLIKKAAIYTEKEMAKLLAKGYNVLVKDGKAVAKRVAREVWGENVLHHTGHIIKKTGKLGKSHFQPLKNLLGKPVEKGWHIFYSAAPVLFFADDAEALAIYEDKYPGESIAHYLTITKYAGEDSWISNLDWVNPLEILAIAGDIGRSIDRELSKELKALVFNRVTPDGSKQTYEMSPDGELVRVIVVNAKGKQKILSAEEYYTILANVPEEKAEIPKDDGTKHPNYASTFDAACRIYISKQGSWWDGKTLSFYLPADQAGKLKKIGQFYVMENLSIKYVYAYVDLPHRSILKQPGFLIPEGLIDAYVESPNKEEYLQKMLTSMITMQKVKEVDLGK